MFGKRIKKSAALVSFGALAAVTQWFWPDPALADQFQRIYRSPYFLGRGDTGVAVADNEEAIFYNPAGLAQGSGIFKGLSIFSPGIEISSDTRSLVKDLASSQGGNTISKLTEHIGENQHIGFNNFSGLLFRRAAIGIVTSNETDVLVYKDPKQGGLEAVQADLYSTTGLTFTLADSFYGGKMLLGMTLAYYKRAQAELDLGLLEAQSLNDTSSIFGYGTTSPVTFGAMFLLPGKNESSIGVTIHNVGDAHVTPDNPDLSVDNLKQRIDLGYASTSSSKAATARLLVDYIDATSAYSSNVYKKLHVGGEIGLGKRVGLSAGLNQGGPCAGIFIDAWLLRIDSGFYTEELSDKVGLRSDRRYFVRIKAGF